MVDVSRETYERNGIETIVDNHRILRFNENHIEKGLDHKDLRAAILKYLSNHRKNRHELDNKSRKQCNRTFIGEKLAIKVIMDCRTTLAHKFRTRLRFLVMPF